MKTLITTLALSLTCSICFADSCEEKVRDCSEREYRDANEELNCAIPSFEKDKDAIFNMLVKKKKSGCGCGGAKNEEGSI